MSKSTDKSFIEKLTAAVERNNSLLCIGLDPNPRAYADHFPKSIDTASLVAWGKNIIDETADLVCCYKPNYAFYEQFGPLGLAALRQTIAAVPEDIPVLLDAKRGDIGSTAAAYAYAAFEVWGADAITISPYLGQDSVTPFLRYPGKMAFILCYTSNPSASEVQEFGRNGDRLFEHILRQGQTWGSAKQIAFVVGATQPGALNTVRSLMSDAPYWILAPGIGAQGGDLGKALSAGLDDSGSGIIVPVSRGVIYDKTPHAAALAMRGEINQVRQRFQLEHGPTLLHRELIQQLYEIGSIQFGEFTLVAGQQSPIYIDLRRIASNTLLLKMVALPYADLLGSLSFDHLAAVPYTSLTIATAVALSTNSSLIYPHQEAKTYEIGQAIEGIFAAGETAVVIEDLVTTGGSALKAIEALEGAGLTVEHVVVLIDWEQGAGEILADRGYRLHAALQMSEILHVLHESGQITAEQVTTVQNFLKANAPSPTD